MGTIAARDALRVLTLVEQVAAATLHATCQGVELRSQLQSATPTPQRLAEFVGQVRQEVAPLEEDRALDRDLNHLCSLIRERHWSLYDAS